MLSHNTSPVGQSPDRPCHAKVVGGCPRVGAGVRRPAYMCRADHVPGDESPTPARRRQRIQRRRKKVGVAGGTSSRREEKPVMLLQGKEAGGATSL
jgi:hypothetical protein